MHISLSIYPSHSVAVRTPVSRQNVTGNFRVHYINKMSIVSGNFSFGCASADLGYYLVHAQSLKAPGLVEANQATAVYNGVRWL